MSTPVALVLSALLAGFGWLYWERLAPYLPRVQRPVLPPEDRAPLASRITFTTIEEYVADGIRGLHLHLMQAARRRSG